MKKRIVAIILFILILFVQAASFSGSVYAADENDTLTDVVYTLGYNYINNFSDTNGIGGSSSYSGYALELAKELSVRVGLNITFERYDNANMIDELVAGNVDLAIVRSDSIVPEDVVVSGAVVNFGHLVLYTLNEKGIYYEDYESFDGMNIGIVDTEFVYEDFEKYAQEHGFGYNEIIFQDLSGALSALENGEIDAFACNSIFSFHNDNLRNIGQIGEYTYSFAVREENAEVIELLFDSFSLYSRNNSDALIELYLRYYGDSIGNEPTISREDGEYLKSLGTIKVGYLKSIFPIECIDSDGNFSGISRAIFDKIQTRCGMDFEYVAYDDVQECYRDFSDGKIDIIAVAMYDCDWADKNDLILSKPYMSIPVVSVSTEPIDIHQGMSSVGLTAFYEFVGLRDDAQAALGGVVYYNDIRECLNAVVDKAVEVSFVNQYSWESYSQMNKYKRLHGEIIPNVSAVFSMVCAKGRGHERLVQIINDSLEYISDKENLDIVTGQIISAKDNGSLLEQFISHYTYELILGTFLLAVIVVSMIVTIKRREERFLAEVAYVDPITKKSNYTKFIIDAEEKLKYSGNKYAIGFINIDNFKSINDFYGREQGDKVLILMSNLLADIMSPDGLFARQSADHFVFMCEYTDYASLKYNIETYITDIDLKTAGFYDQIRLTCNCGVYLVEENDSNIYNMIDKAAIAEKHAKEKLDENVVKYDTSINARFLLNQEMTASMEKALVNEEFVVYYQPKIDIQTEKPVGCEALVRWISPTKGFMSPDVFIPLFEKNGFVTDLDFYVLDKVCDFIKRREENGEKMVPVNINQSRLHVNDVMYLSRLQNVLYEKGVGMHQVIFEITESAFIESQADMISLINRMKNMGFAFSMDDFGSGYSSFNLLKDMDIDELKIDKEFLHSTLQSDRSRFIIKNIIRMAHGLGIKVVCEGVETKEQLDFLKSVSCDIVQGYYYAKPMCMEDFVKYLDSF